MDFDALVNKSNVFDLWINNNIDPKNLKKSSPGIYSINFKMKIEDVCNSNYTNIYNFYSYFNEIINQDEKFVLIKGYYDQIDFIEYPQFFYDQIFRDDLKSYAADLLFSILFKSSKKPVRSFLEHMRFLRILSGIKWKIYKEELDKQLLENINSEYFGDYYNKIIGEPMLIPEKLAENYLDQLNLINSGITSLTNYIHNLFALALFNENYNYIVVSTMLKFENEQVLDQISTLVDETKKIKLNPTFS